MWPWAVCPEIQQHVTTAQQSIIRGPHGHAGALLVAPEHLRFSC